MDTRRPGAVATLVKHTARVLFLEFQPYFLCVEFSGRRSERDRCATDLAGAEAWRNIRIRERREQGRRRPQNIFRFRILRYENVDGVPDWNPEFKSKIERLVAEKVSS